jgi:phosphatidylglycerophosphate synthase
MARSDHNREAYRLLFGYVGAGLQAFAGLMILISIPVAPGWVIILLGGALVVSSAWSWTRYRSNFMMPTFTGTAMAGLWMLVVGLGAMLGGWGP